MDNYIFIENINSGEYGDVIKVKNKLTNKYSAVKIENKNIGILCHEAKIYNYLFGINNIPVIKSYKIDKENNYLFMELMDYNLKTFKNLYYQNVKDTKDTKDINDIDLNNINNCKKIIIDLINILKNIHNKNIIHRDIKPENICFKNNIVKLIDFGLAKYLNYKLYDTKNNNSNNNNNNNIIGTPNYVSKNVINNIEPSYWDELESLCYIYIYLIIKDEEFKKYCSENNKDKKNIDIINSYITDISDKNIIKNHINLCRNNDINIYNNLIKLYI